MPIYSNVAKIHSNSTAGVRALACASPTCRALASPYFFKPLKCEFRELVRNDCLESPPVVTLSTADNFKTLRLHSGLQPGRDRLRTITQILSVEHNYDCFEYLPNRSRHHFSLSAPALGFLSRTLPLLSSLVIDLGEFVGYSTSWDQAYRKASGNNTRNSYAPLARLDGLDVVCALARFENLRHLTLYYKLQQDEIALMHPTLGCEAVRELFECIQRRKRSQALVRLDVVFYAHAFTMFRCLQPSLHIYSSILSTTMTITCNNDTSRQVEKQPQYNCTCNDPQYGKVIERRKRTERLYGKSAWAYSLERVQWKLLQGKHRTLPWGIVMESMMWLALLPSKVVFEDGKRVRYEPSLANVEVNRRNLKRPTSSKESLLRRMLSL